MDTGQLFLLLIVLAIVAFVWWPTTKTPTTPTTPSATTPTTPTTPYTAQNLTILAWNLQIYGPTKASQPGLIDRILKTINGSDIVFLQEIRDESDTHDAFATLCTQLPHYKCAISSRAGRTDVKEQYGLLYKDTVTLSSMVDYNPDALDRWERPPLKTVWRLNDYTLTIYTIHTKPTAVAPELTQLQSLINDSGNVLVIGDLNADCVYYTPDQDASFDTWFWAIQDGQRTNLGSDSCAYDRIIMNADLAKEYIIAHPITTALNNTVSDHYPIELTIKPQDQAP